jgi:hypothetical protein
MVTRSRCWFATLALSCQWGTFGQYHGEVLLPPLHLCRFFFVNHFAMNVILASPKFSHLAFSCTHRSPYLLDEVLSMCYLVGRGMLILQTRCMKANTFLLLHHFIYRICLHYLLWVSTCINATSYFRHLQREASVVCSWQTPKQGWNESFGGIPSASLHFSRSCWCFSCWHMQLVVCKGDVFYGAFHLTYYA